MSTSDDKKKSSKPATGNANKPKQHARFHKNQTPTGKDKNVLSYTLSKNMPNTVQWEDSLIAYYTAEDLFPMVHWFVKYKELLQFGKDSMPITEDDMNEINKDDWVPLRERQINAIYEDRETFGKKEKQPSDDDTPTDDNEPSNNTNEPSVESTKKSSKSGSKVTTRASTKAAKAAESTSSASSSSSASGSSASAAPLSAGSGNEAPVNVAPATSKFEEMMIGRKIDLAIKKVLDANKETSKINMTYKTKYMAMALVLLNSVDNAIYEHIKAEGETYDLACANPALMMSCILEYLQSPSNLADSTTILVPEQIAHKAENHQRYGETASDYMFRMRSLFAMLESNHNLVYSESTKARIVLTGATCENRMKYITQYDQDIRIHQIKREFPSTLKEVGIIISTDPSVNSIGKGSTNHHKDKNVAAFNVKQGGRNSRNRHKTKFEKKSDDSAKPSTQSSENKAKVEKKADDPAKTIKELNDTVASLKAELKKHSKEKPAKVNSVKTEYIVDDVEEVDEASFNVKADEVINVSINVTKADVDTDKVRIDSQSGIHFITNLNLIKDGSIMPCYDQGLPRVRLSGIITNGGHTTIDQVGLLKGLNIWVYVTSGTVVTNILSFAKLSDTFEIKTMSTGLKVTSKDQQTEMFFGRDNDDRYTLSVKEYINAVLESETVEILSVNSRGYTDQNGFEHVMGKSAMKRINIVQNMRANLKVSDAEMTRMIQRNYKGTENLSADDVTKCTQVYGPDVGIIRGRAQNRQPKVENVTAKPLFKGTIAAAIDIIFLGTCSWLFTLLSPGNLVMTVPVEHRNADEIQGALRTTLSTIRSKGWIVNSIDHDNEKSFGKLVSWLMSEYQVSTNPTGSRNCLPTLNAYVKLIKERFRSLISDLPFKVPDKWYDYVMKSAVAIQNMVPPKEGLPPRQWFTDTKVKLKDFEHGTMRVVEAMTEKSDNSVKPRTNPCLILYPSGNLAGSYKVLNLNTGRVCIAGVLTSVPYTSFHLGKIAELAGDTLRLEGSSIKDANIDKDLTNVGAERQDVELPLDPNHPIALLTTAKLLGRDESVFDVIVKWDEMSDEEASKLSDSIEIKQLIEKKVFGDNVKYPLNGAVLPVSMIRKRKVDSNGVPIKMKSRLVAIGWHKDRSLITGNTAAYTPHLPFVFALISIAAFLQKSVKVLDVTGAYLNADMKDETYVILSKKIAASVLKVKPEWKHCVRKN